MGGQFWVETDAGEIVYSRWYGYDHVAAFNACVGGKAWWPDWWDRSGSIHRRLVLPSLLRRLRAVRRDGPLWRTTRCPLDWINLAPHNPWCPFWVDRPARDWIEAEVMRVLAWTERARRSGGKAWWRYSG